MVNRHMKRCSTSLFISEVNVKATVRYHLIQVRMASVKKIKRNECLPGCGEKGALVHCWWECKIAATMENSIEVPQKIKTSKYHITQ